MFVGAVCGTCRTPHPLAAPQPAAWPPGAAPPSAAGRAVAARPATRPAARSERRAPRRPAASPPGRSRSAGPGSADSLKHKFAGFTDYVKLLTGEGKNNKKNDVAGFEYLGACGSSEREPLQLVSPLRTRSCIPLPPRDS